MQINIPWCPVVSPTQKEFKNFYQFVEQMDRLYAKDYGMVKVPELHSTRHCSSSLIFFFTSLNSGDSSCRMEAPLSQLYQQSGQHANSRAHRAEHLRQGRNLRVPPHSKKKSLTYKEYKKKTQPLDRIPEGRSPEEVEDLVRMWLMLVLEEYRF